MTSLKENLAAAAEKDFPNDLHERIMNSVVFARQFRILSRSIVSAFSAVFLSSAIYFYLRLAENEFFIVCRAMLEGLQADYGEISASLEAIVLSLPFQATLTFAIALVLAAAVFIGLRKFNMNAYYFNKIYSKVE